MKCSLNLGLDFHLDIVIYMTKYMVMMMYKIERANVGQVKEHFSAYVAKAEKGEPTLVCRRNRPVAELVPIARQPAANGTRLGSARGSVVVECDLNEPAIADTDWDALT